MLSNEDLTLGFSFLTHSCDTEGLFVIIDESLYCISNIDFAKFATGGSATDEEQLREVVEMSRVVLQAILKLTPFQLQITD